MHGFNLIIILDTKIACMEWFKGCFALPVTEKSGWVRQSRQLKHACTKLFKCVHSLGNLSYLYPATLGQKQNQYNECLVQ